MRKKLRLYLVDTKLKVVFDKQKGKNNKEIQEKYKIKNRSQIYKWVQLYENEGVELLEQSIRDKNKQIESTEEMNVIKTTINKKIATSLKKNRKLYLEIIDEYKHDVSLNQLTKWLHISKTSYYRWIEQSINPRPHNDLEKALAQICKQNSYITTDGKRRRRLGYRIVHQKLIDLNFKINPKTVLKLMHKFGLLSERIHRKPQYYYDLEVQKENNLDLKTKKYLFQLLWIYTNARLLVIIFLRLLMLILYLIL